MQSQEWEGFESFGDEGVHQLVNILDSNQIHLRKQDPAKEQSSISIFSKKTSSQNKKKISFKATTRRKISVFQSEEPKKTSEKKSQDNLRPESRRSSLYLEKSPVKQKENPNLQKEERIPIFRFPNMCQIGKLIYKGFLPIYANEYFKQYGEGQNIRDTTQSLMGESIRNSLKGTVQQREQLIFNSKFENGNLDLVRKFNNQYHLYLAPDTNSKGHRQWFYFTVTSYKERKVKIVIHGFKKRLSLYQKGMKPYGKRIQEPVECWRPIGSNVLYLKEEIRPKIFMKKVQYEYCLLFNLALDEDQTLCIASCIPYSYNYLKFQLGSLQLSPHQHKFSQTIFCKTLMGLEVPLLTFGQQTQHKQQKFIIINARTHPGESSSSWVMQGILEYLSHSEISQRIIKQSNLVIKIVPMLNPDGVYMGNYRTGIMGVDYNRLFNTGEPDVFPEVETLKRLVQSCKKAGKIDLYLDLHGHSIHPGCFIYGPDPCFSPPTPLKNLYEKLQNIVYFAGRHCKVGVDNSKSQTSRVYFQLHQGIYSLTCENSLGLRYTDIQKGTIKQFDALSWKHFGADLIESILTVYKDSYGTNQKIGLEELLITQKEKSLKKDCCKIEKSKTDTQDMTKHIESLRSLDLEDVDLNNHYNEMQSDYDSINDSDDQSDNLSPQKHSQLLGIVSKIIQKRKNQQTERENESQSKSEFRNRAKKGTKGQCLGNFKEYHFGHEETTMFDWFARKRLLSVPKVLKAQKINQSYIIRKATPKPFSNDLMFQSIQCSRKTKTEIKESDSSRMESRLSRYKNELRKQKRVTEFGRHLKN